MSMLQVVGAGIVSSDESHETDLNDMLMSFSDNHKIRNINDVLISDMLSKRQKDQLIHEMVLFQGIFSDEPGSTDIVEHRIELTGDNPVRAKLYPLPYSVKHVIDDEIKKMLQLDVIEPSESAYVSPIVLVRKRDSSFRC